MMPITRKPGWRNALIAWLAQAARTPFEEGVNDCALFAAGAVLAMTGTDLAEGWRGRYRSTRGGLRALRRAGYADHVDLVARHFAEVPPSLAQAGDLAVLPGGPGGQGRPGDGAAAIGIVQGAAIYVIAPGGLGVVPLTMAERAFRV